MILHSDSATSLSTRRNGNAVLRISLNQREAACWLPLLIRLSAQAPSVASFREKLEDALRLAIWSRNEVVIEIAADELAGIVETLAEAAESVGREELESLGDILLALSTRNRET